MRYPVWVHSAEGGRRSHKTTEWERDRRRQLVRQLTNAGESASRLAVRFGVSKRTIERDRRATAC